MNNWFGVVGVVTGHYRTETAGPVSVDTKLHTFMGGPKFTYRTNRVAPYITLLAGGARVGAKATAAGGTETVSETRLAAHTGAGVDLNVTSRLGVRVGVNELYIRGDAAAVAVGQAIEGRHALARHTVIDRCDHLIALSSR